MNQETIIPFTDFGGEGMPAHFAHANGYPPGCYQELIDLLKADYHILSKHYRPLWDDDHRQLKSWQLFSGDLIRFMEGQHMQNIVGFGHSMGALTSLVAAVQHPNLFSKLVLIEPVILPKSAYWLNWLPVSISKKILPIAKIALKRKDQWESKEALFESFRKKKVFRNISDKGLRLFAEHATKPSINGGVELAYSKDWEAQVYCTPIYPWDFLRKIDIPVLIIRGEHSNVLINSIWEDLKATVQNGTFVSMENVGHLAPLEAPEEINQIIQEWV